ncbi:MAG: beta-lactamase family protein [Lentisphaeria bacterium]|nr:beta-lactamase family protein [Lentisphaeria bacterium]
MEYKWQELVPQLQKVLDDAVSSGAECGCQLAIYRHGKPVVDLCAGTFAHDRSKKIAADSLFPVFSCGKAVLATAVLQAVERGAFALNTPVKEIWSSFAAPDKAEITVEHILSHRAGLYILPRSTRKELANWQLMCDKIAAMPPRTPAGKKCVYHPLTFGYLAGNLLVQCEKKTLAEILKRDILEPCGIAEEFLFGCGSNESCRYTFLDDSAMPQQPSWYSEMMDDPTVRSACIPSFNGCASARAMAKFYAALAGEIPGVRLLKPETLVLAAGKLWRDPDDLIPENSWNHFGLGYILCGPPGQRGRMFGHGGAAGAEAFYDWRTGIAFGFTKNRPLPTHPYHPIRETLSEILALPPRNW